MKKYAVYLLATFAVIISVAAYNANAADNASSITDVCDVNGTDYKSESWSNEQYPVIDLFGEKEVPLFTANGNIGNIHVNKLAKLILDDNEAYTLTDGEKLDLGNGYTLEAKQINIDNEEIWFEFSKDGKYITDQIVSASNEGNRTWTVTLDNVQGENNIVVMKVHIKNLFVGTETRVVWIDGLWLIDYANTTTLKVGNKIGEFTLEKIVSGVNTSNMGSLVFENTTGSSVACNVVGTNYKCDSWPNAAANTANTVDTASAADTTISNNNTYNVVYADYKCESWSDEQYPVIDLFGDKYVPLFNDSENIRDLHVNKLARLILDSNETYTFKNNEKLNLGNGYALEAKKIDIDNETVWLEFTKDGKFVVSQNISVNTGENNKTWNVTLDNVEGENNIVVMKVYVNQLFAGVENNIVRIDGVWLIDYANARTLNIGDKLGDFTLKEITSGIDKSNLRGLVFKNDMNNSSVTCNIVGTNYKCSTWSNEQYPLIRLFEENYVPLFANNSSIWQSNIDKLAKLVLDSNETYTLEPKEKLDLGHGYALEAKKIDIVNETVLLELTRDGQHVAEKNISISTEDNKTWNIVKDNIQGENDTVVMKVHVKQSFVGTEKSIVWIDGIWLIDYANARTLNIGDKLEGFTLEKIIGGVDEADPGSLIFESVPASASNCSAPSDSEKVPAKFTNKSMESSILWCKEFWGYISMKSKQTFC
ncbi:S-layer protein domain-containing protein [Methanosarcina sp.]|uniref:S-layer protein domain-containing protein n=1 Tax=Methanosarcina sp. TaxID=2213 RepID=UPI0029895A0D|nr:S-layer protein domain-containing protein [Methanosarcina sp.]MDW5548702.1 S-layer protein domain-containing protein [Methanosarcina sp.]MDW5553833.1 S-layer protein domain-containing protein [Methanosarcina sp.]MDW5558841.1 S-layer protein domain-containing protein [Methanosarcina sp.]